ARSHRGGLAGGPLTSGEGGRLRRVDMAFHSDSPPPSAAETSPVAAPPPAGETSPAALRFRAVGPGGPAEGGTCPMPAACAAAGDPRRCASRGRSRARPREHRLLTVPSEPPSTPAAPPTG